uniref:Uncharacterized protein n=1 Tax=Desertifilum tharense IPPAS B-1220 TaxID=1781255 RepID=A0ACD5GQ89_9CYAN
MGEVSAECKVLSAEWGEVSSEFRVPKRMGGWGDGGMGGIGN